MAIGCRFRRVLPATIAVVAFPLAIACGSRSEDRDDARPRATPAVTPKPAAEARPRIVVLGDSLTAGLGLDV